MRVGIDARLVYYSQAGIGQYIVQLVQALSRLAAEEEFLLLHSRKDGTILAPQAGFTRIPIWTPSHHRFEQLTLSMELALLGLDLLHSPDFVPPFHRRFRSIITVHDLAFLLYPHFLTRQAARYYGQIDQAVRVTDHVIAVSESTKADIVGLLGVPEEKITVIYEAAKPIFRSLERDVSRAEVRERYGLDDPFLLAVGTVEPRKNLMTLFEALRVLEDRRQLRPQLAVVGSRGWLFEETLARVKELGLEERVRFLGRLPDEELLCLYNAARVHVYPSLYEGFGLPPLEAMACGTPTVSSNVSSIPEVVGDAALLVDPHDPVALAEALWRMLVDEDLQGHLSRRGLERATAFSWDRAARETLAVYQRVGAG